MKFKNEQNYKIWNQSGCPSTNKWIKNMQHTYTVEYYSAINKNEILLSASKQMDLGDIKFSEIIQKDQYFMLSFICGS